MVNFNMVDFLMSQADSIEEQIKALDTVRRIVIPDKPIKKFKPSENLFGYRWVKSTQGKTYIVKIRIIGDYWHDPDVANMLDYITENCSVVSIEDIESGMETEDIGQPQAYFHSNVTYRKGSNIDEQKTWFCLSKKALFLSQGQAINKVQHKEIIPVDIQV